jgi:hypothetical protein
MAESKFSLFGIKFGKKHEEPIIPSFVEPQNEDGAITVSGTNFFASTLDVDGLAKNETELITRYREMALQPEIMSAIDDIINESISFDDNGKNIDLVLDDLEISDKIKSVIEEEFQTILKLLNYNNMAADIFRRFYVDGRLFFHVIIDSNELNNGIVELRYIDPRKIKKVREVKKAKDPNTGVDMIIGVEEYYIYNDKSITSMNNNVISTQTLTGLKIAPESIVFVTSGLMDAKKNVVISYLHNAIRPLNQLRMIEDAALINKIVRSPIRRIFYIDVSNLPKQKAENYINEMMQKYRNKLVYNYSTGEVTSSGKHLSMLEDYWIPRRADSKATEITTLEGADSFQNMDMINYFEQKLYKALNVPVGRLNPESAFSMGRSNEITRDELKFAKFIDRLRNKFTELFDQLLRIQLVLKGICTTDEWDEFKENVFYDFIRDNNFVEMRDAELVQNRLGMLSLIDPFVGRYYSRSWVQQNVLRLNDEEIKELEKEMDEEAVSDIQKDAEKMAMQMQVQQQLGMDGQVEQGNEQASQNKPGMSNKNPYNV